VSLHATWPVQRFHRAYVAYILLQGAAYGRYLAVLPEPVPRGHVRVEVVV
jgi:hypothetical protein